LRCLKRLALAPSYKQDDGDWFAPYMMLQCTITVSERIVA
jgi:hypothetical protein